MDTMTVPDALKASLPVATPRQHSEVIIRSSQIWAEGCQRLGALMAATTQGHFERASSTWQAMGQAKSLKEVVEIQTSYARTSVEHAIASTKQLIEATNELAQNTMEPIKQRMGDSWATPPLQAGANVNAEPGPAPIISSPRVVKSGT